MSAFNRSNSSESAAIAGTSEALRELRAAVRARQRAEAELASLYRERAIQRARAAERDPALLRVVAP